MLWRTRAQRWLAAIVAVATAVALQAASVRAIECARAKALVGAAWAEEEHAAGASTSRAAHGGAASLAGEDASVADDERGTCVSVVVLAPPALSTFAFPGAFDVVSTAARARARTLSSGLERPPRLA